MTESIEIYKAVLNKRLNRVPRGFWEGNIGKERAKHIVKYLLEELLNYSREDICKNFSYKFLTKYKLGGVLVGLFNNSAYELLDFTYPNEYKQWELGSVPRGFWGNRENVIEALIWVCDTYLDGDISRVPKELTSRFLSKIGLASITVEYSLHECITMAFGEDIKPWMLNTPRNYWESKENRVQAVRWLVEEHLGNDTDRVNNEYGEMLFREHRMWQITENNRTPYSLLVEAYGNKYNPSKLRCNRRVDWTAGEMVS